MYTPLKNIHLVRLSLWHFNPIFVHSVSYILSEKKSGTFWNVFGYLFLALLYDVVGKGWGGENNAPMQVAKNSQSFTWKSSRHFEFAKFWSRLLRIRRSSGQICSLFSQSLHAARLSSGRFADFLLRMVLADFLLETFARFSRNYVAYSVKIFNRIFI